jgi:hypothetical protein
MRSTITVLAWDKTHGKFKTTIVVDHIVRWVDLVEVEPQVYGQIADHDSHFFAENEAEGRDAATGVLLSNGEHLIVRMPVGDFELLFEQSSGGVRTDFRIDQL